MSILEKRSFGIPCYKLGIDIANCKVHLGKLPSSLIWLLPINRDILNISLMLFDKFFTHDKHSSTSTCRIIDESLIRLNHLYHQFYDRFWSIELPSLFPLSICKLSQKILIYSSKKIFRILTLFFEFSIGNQINQSSKCHHIQIWLSKDFRQNIFKLRIFLFYRIHSLI